MLEVKNVALFIIYTNIVFPVSAVKIIHPDGGGKVLEKKLPASMTVGKLKALIFRVFKIDSDIKLFYKSHKVMVTLLVTC